MKIGKDEKTLIYGVAIFAVLTLVFALFQHSEFYNRVYEVCKKNKTGDVALALLDCHCVASRAERIKNKLGVYTLADPETWSTIAITCVK